MARLIAEQLEIPPEKLEEFSTFARSEPYISDISFPVIDPEAGAVPSIPVGTQPPPVKSPPIKPVKNNLPSQSTSFFGRENEIAEITQLLQIDERRLVTIVGPGGMGKTRLALACAEGYLGNQRGAPLNSKLRFSNGVFFVEMTPLSDPENLVHAMAKELGFSLQVSDQKNLSMKQQILDFFQDREILLLLDNFEHLLDAAEIVVDILNSCPKIQILVTSRERLNLHEEQVYPIQGLELPNLAEPEEAPEKSALKLFLQSAQIVQPRFTLPSDLTDLIQICRLVEGVPLGVKLAAAWVDTLSLADIAAEIQESLDFLETNIRNLPARHRSMRATFDYSWQKLEEKERSVFAQISIFRGGFTRKAFQSVTGATLRQLSKLVNKSFIQFDGKRSRYQVHELLRQFAADKLKQNVKLERSAENRHSTYYCQEIESLTDDLKGDQQLQALDAIETDLENVRLAWNHAVKRQELALIGQSIEALYRFYWNRPVHLKDGVKDFERAVVVFRIDEPIGEREIVLGRLLAVLGWFYLKIVSTKRNYSEKVAKESLEILTGLGAREATLMSLLCLAFVYDYDDNDESYRLLQESLALANEIGDQWAIGDAQLRLGLNARYKGDFRESNKNLRLAIKQFEQNGDWGGVSWARAWLSGNAVEQGLYNEALVLAQENIPLLSKLSYPIPVYYALGVTYYELGLYEEAEEQFQMRLEIIKERGSKSDILDNLYFLGKITFKKGDLILAEQYLREYLDGALIYEEIDLVIKTHDALGRVKLAQGSTILGREHLFTAMQMAVRLSRESTLIEIMITVAELFTKEGRYEQAALTAVFITDHPASTAKINERAVQLLSRLQAKIPANDLKRIRQRSGEADLDTLAARLLIDLKSPDQGKQSDKKDTQ